MIAGAILKEILPPFLVRLVSQITRRSTSFVAAPRSWDQALARTAGYSEPAILERVIHASREVLAGRAAFERDSVLFDRLELPYQLLAPLLRCAVVGEGHLEVIDFGGALGSTYRQCRSFLPLKSLQWHVVEQAEFVAAGRAEFANAELQFHESMQPIATASSPRVLIASSVLQYLQQPALALAGWASVDADMLVIDRTPLSDESADQLCIQRVPKHIYDASYPCWVFSRARLLEVLSPAWSLLTEFDCPEGTHRLRHGTTFAFKGMLLERKR